MSQVFYETFRLFISYILVSFGLFWVGCFCLVVLLSHCFLYVSMVLGTSFEVQSCRKVIKFSLRVETRFNRGLLSWTESEEMAS